MHISEFGQKFNIARRQLLLDLLGRTGNGVRTVWSIPGHLFILTDFGHSLYTFDTRQSQVTATNQRLGCELDRVKSASAIVTVLELPQAPTDTRQVIVIFENGCAEIWAYDKKEQCWSLDRTRRLCLSGSQRVLSVTIFDGSSSTISIVWCEEDDAVCTVYHTNIVDDGSERVVLLTGCPRLELCRKDQAVVLWSPVLPGVYMQWLPQAASVEVYEASKGLLWKEPARTVTPHDCVTLVKRAVAGWSASGGSSFRAVPCTSKHGLCFLDPSTPQIVVVAGAFKQNHQNYRLSLSDDNFRQGHLFMLHDSLGLAYHHTVRLYSKDGCQLLAEVPVGSEETVVAVYAHDALIPAVLIQTHSNLYFLQLPLRRLQRTNQALTTSTYSSALALHRLHKSDQCFDLKHIPTRAEESPAVLLTFVQQDLAVGADRYQWPTTDLAEILKTDLDRRDFPTALKRELEPYLKKTYMLEMVKHHVSSQCLSAQVSTQVFYDVEMQIKSLLLPTCPLKALERQLQLQRLAKSKQNTVLHVLLDHVQLNTDALNTTDVQRWRDLLSMEGPMKSPTPLSSPKKSGGLMESSVSLDQGTSRKYSPGPNDIDRPLPLYEMLCRLFYLEYPGKLINFVKCSLKVQEQHVEVAGYGAGLWKNLYSRTLSCLPPIAHSNDVQSAAKASAKLLLLSGKPHAEMKALKLLVQWSLWEKAVLLVKHYADNSPRHCQLFSVLLLDLLKVKAPTTFICQLLEHTPQRINTSEVLLNIERGVRTVADFCDQDCFPREDAHVQLPVGILRNFLQGARSSV